MIYNRLYLLRMAATVSLIPQALPLIWLWHALLLIWADCACDRNDIMLLLRLDDRRQYKFCLVLFRHLLWSSATVSSGGGTEAPGSSPTWATADSKDQPGRPVMDLQKDAQPPWSCPSDAMRSRTAEPARLCPKGRFLSKINECYFKPPSLELVCNTDRKRIRIILLYSFTKCVF